MTEELLDDFSDLVDMDNFSKEGRVRTDVAVFLVSKSSCYLEHLEFDLPFDEDTIVN